MTGREARDDEREAALRTIESLHPTARIALGSSTHGGPTQYGEGCGLHGAWCRDWQRTRKAVETLREGYRKHPEPERDDETRGMTNAERHVLSTADAGTDHIRHPRQYVVACEWCDEIFYGPRFKDAMSQFEGHRDAMHAQYQTEVSARRALRVPVGEGEQGWKHETTNARR